MTVPGPLGEQGQDSRAEELKRRHVDARRRRIRRRRTWIVIAAVAAVVLAVVLAVVTVYALEPKRPVRESGAIATSASPKPVSSTVAENPDTAPPTPVATPTATAGSETTTTPTPAPAPKPKFVAGRALRDVRALEAFGVRSGGSGAERRGAAYISMRLRGAGVVGVEPPFQLSKGETSRNVIAVLPGESTKTIILGAHMDSKYPSPGANDNGSGCGALLEIARCLAKQPAYPTVKLVFFGTEEMIDADPDHHHYGSRAFVAEMSKAARDNVAGMISVDMIGYGPDFVVRSMGRGPQTMVRLLQQQARKRDIRLSYLIDPGPSGYSDHEAFELAGIPAAWIEWRDDPVYHTAADTSRHLVAAKVRQTGQFLLDVLYGMDDATLRKLNR